MGYWSISTSNDDGWKHTKHTEVSDNAKKQTKTHWSPLENARIDADSPFCNPSCTDKLSAQRQQHWRPDGQPGITHSPMKGHNAYKVILHHPENQTQIWSSLDPTAKLWVREDRGTRPTAYLMGMRPAKSSPWESLSDKRRGFFNNYVSGRGGGKKGWRQKSYVKGNFKKKSTNHTHYNQSYWTSNSNCVFFKASHYIYGKTDHLNIGRIDGNIKQLLFSSYYGYVFQ